MLKKCALCDTAITADNDSKEHVIPNAIGGRKKITGFICNTCNNNSGGGWEKELAKQLNPLSLFFRIKRERGKAPSEVFNTNAGEQYRLNVDGSMEDPKPSYKEEINEAGVEININARSTKEAKKILMGVNRKYPSADVLELIENAKLETSYCPDMIKLSLSFLRGGGSGRSIVKSALALAVEAGVSSEKCEHAREYLLSENGDPCFGYYYENDLVLNRPLGIPIHCVYVEGNPSTGLLLAYIEFFGVQRMVSCLSNSYKGQQFYNSYSIDPVNGVELNLHVNLNLSIEDIHACYRNEKVPKGSMEAALSSVIPIQMKAHQDQERSRVMHMALKKAFEFCGAKEGEVLTQAHKKKIVEMVMSEVSPVIIHQLGLYRKRV